MIYVYNDVALRWVKVLIKFKASQLWNQLPNEFKKPTPFVRCVCQGRPSYGGGRTAMLLKNVGGEG